MEAKQLKLQLEAWGIMLLFEFFSHNMLTQNQLKLKFYRPKINR